MSGQLCTHRVEPYLTTETTPPWDAAARASFYPDLVTEVPKEDTAAVRRHAVDESLQRHGDFTLQVWTDGSVEQGVSNGGSAAVFVSLIDVSVA